MNSTDEIKKAELTLLDIEKQVDKNRDVCFSFDGIAQRKGFTIEQACFIQSNVGPENCKITRSQDEFYSIDVYGAENVMKIISPENMISETIVKAMCERADISKEEVSETPVALISQIPFVPKNIKMGDKGREANEIYDELTERITRLISEKEKAEKENRSSDSKKIDAELENAKKELEKLKEEIRALCERTLNEENHKKEIKRREAARKKQLEEAETDGRTTGQALVQGLSALSIVVALNTVNGKSAVVSDPKLCEDLLTEATNSAGKGAVEYEKSGDPNKAAEIAMSAFGATVEVVSRSIDQKDKYIEQDAPQLDIGHRGR